uniref:FBA_2 domain-containing protein n=1 Tax=Caenorhabditis tropicalis TaxID=1561998 RepID=A0A1I7UYP0_9PELO
MERIVKYADLETRKNLAQTSIPFNRIALRPIIIKRLDVSFVPDTIRIDVDSDPKRSYHRVRRSNFNPNPLKGCVTQVGGDIWLDPSKEIDYEAEGMLAWISRRAQTIETMELLVYNRPCNPRNLPVVNLYTNLDSLEPFVPGVLKKVVQHTINGRISLATDSEQWNQLESFHAFGFFPDFDTVWPRSLHLKYGMFGIWERVTVEQVIRMKDDLLQNPEIQEREVNVMMSREEIDRLNDTLHTYNTTETIHPMSVGFLYPHDRQRILLMNVKSHSINENRNAVCCVNFTGFTLSGQTRAAKHYYFRIREWVHRQALRHDEDN